MGQQSSQKSEYFLTRWLFLRLLALVYFFAFSSLATQAVNLFGSHGILPINEFLYLVKMNLGNSGAAVLPTLFWFNDSDLMLRAVCILGSILSLAAVLGMGTGCVFLLLWILYLSLVNVGQDFLSFQWDALLLEIGFLAVFFAPWQILEWPWTNNVKQPPKIILWLLWWLLFRLMFESGLVKLASGDPAWHNLSALDFHYLTQPLPTPLAWYAAKLPHWFNEISVVLVFVIELGIPFLIFMGRKARIFAAALLVFLQFLIALTGNYAYFNLLTFALCICLLDDQFMRNIVMQLCSQTGIIRSRLKNMLTDQFLVQPLDKKSKAMSIVIGTFFLCLSIGSLGRGFVGVLPIPAFLEGLHDLVSTYYICNNYGLFAVMTTKRIEIQIEGSNDKSLWQEYQFKYKPGNLATVPCVVAPFQPRLDWQMWFAALGDPGHDRWFVNLLYRLLQGEKTTLQLLAKNPFPNSPPKYIRAKFYDYQFTNASEHQATGNWWKRTYLGECMPVLTLGDR